MNCSFPYNKKISEVIQKESYFYNYLREYQWRDWNEKKQIYYK